MIAAGLKFKIGIYSVGQPNYVAAVIKALDIKIEDPIVLPVTIVDETIKSTSTANETLNINVDFVYSWLNCHRINYRIVKPIWGHTF